MAQNPSFLKRQKELARQEKQKEKEAKRKQRKAEKEERDRLGIKVDDIIYPDQMQ
jgi:hypothetical protein